jgi:hypothetical protein
MLTVLNSANLTPLLGVSSELPWLTANEPLFIKNAKRVYVERELRDEASVIQTLDNSVRGVDRTTTIRAYVAVDAKNQPSGFESVVNTIANLKNSATFATQGQRECTVSQEFRNDLLVTEFEFQFRELVVN